MSMLAFPSAIKGRLGRPNFLQRRQRVGVEGVQDQDDSSEAPSTSPLFLSLDDEEDGSSSSSGMGLCAAAGFPNKDDGTSDRAETAIGLSSVLERARAAAAAASSAKASATAKASLRYQSAVTTLRSRTSRPVECTLLHKMCRPGVNKYHVRVVSSYLEAHPEDVLVVDKCGMTPLHNVLAGLPDRDDIINLLIEKAPKACEMRDDDGMTPLHHAARNANEVSTEVLTTLLKMDPALALDEDLNGETPFSLYCGALEQKAREAQDDEVLREEAEESEETETAVSIDQVLEKCVPIVRAIVFGDPGTDPQEEDDNNDDAEAEGAEDDNNEEDDNDQDQEKMWEGMLHATLYAVERATSKHADIGTAKGRKKVSNAVTAAHKRRYRLLIRAVLNRMYKAQTESEEEQQQQQQQQPAEENNEQQQNQPQEQAEEGGDNEDGNEGEQQQDQQGQAEADGNGAQQQDENGAQQGQPQQAQQQPQQQPQPQEDEEEEIHHPNPASEIDSQGNLPLHIAASIHFLNEAMGGGVLCPLHLPPSSISNNNDNVKAKSAKEGIIDAMMRLHPEAASARNSSGLLPFDVAERHRCGWKRGGVKAMLNANRSVLFGMELPESAMPRVFGRVGNSPELSAMFEVLRERPEALVRAASALSRARASRKARRRC